MKYKETETVELKKSTSELKEAIISICAILNKYGKGTVYFGIKDDGKVVGQQIGKLTVRDISKSISDHIDPKIYPDINIQKITNKDCIVVGFTGHEPIYSAFGRFYLRAGDEDKKLSTKEIEHLVEKKKNYAYSWGAEVSHAPISSANISAIRSFIKRGKEAGRISFSFDSAKNVLNKLHLIKTNKLLNAGQALFCKNNDIEVQAAVFAGKDKITFLDIQSFHGNLFDLIEKSETYIKEHINWRADLSGSRRIEIPEVPVRAIKEAIINSLCHRDFTNPKSNEIAIYRDRIEIYNPGQFPYDHEPAEFIAGKGKSIPRNPLIADAFYLAKDIERWGSGLKRISEECKDAGVRVEFERILSGFQVKFYRPKITQVSAKAQKREGVNEGVNEGVISLLEYIRKNPGQRVPSISQGLNIPPKTLERWLKNLKSEGKIRYEGSAKSGGYWTDMKK